MMCEIILWGGCAYIGYVLGESIYDVESEYRYNKYKKETLKILQKYDSNIIFFVDMRTTTGEDEIRYRTKDSKKYKVMNTDFFDELIKRK